MKTIKYRQAIYSNGRFAYWHYWGFNGDGAFVKPMEGDDCGESYQNITLKDKNGKEIYEGDVVQINEHSKGYKPFWRGKYEVVWRADRGKFCLDKKDNWELIWDMEILGNVFENPELLKEEQK